MSSPEVQAADDGMIATILNGNASEKLKKLLGSYFVVKTAHSVTKKAYHSTRQHFTYTIAVPSEDEIYPVLHERILALIPEEKRRSIVVRSLRNDKDSADDFIAPLTAHSFASPSRSRRSTNSTFRPRSFFDSTKEQTVHIGGYRILVILEKEESINENHNKKERILFTAYGIDARNALMGFITEITESLNEENLPKFYMSTSWGDWQRRDDLQPRELDTVYLPKGQKDSLIADLEKFLGLRPSYERLGIPWHRGYLFHGPAGTGKTSLAKALATHFELDIYYLPISDLEKDTSLMTMISRVPAKSILLLEDIDIVHGAHSREDEYGGVTMSGLLNALDGIGTPSGLITIMTTNNRDILDDALIRPGRIDREEYIGHMDEFQLQSMAEGFFGKKVKLPPLKKEITPAEIAEVLKREMGDPKRQLQSLQAFLASRTLTSV